MRRRVSQSFVVIGLGHWGSAIAQILRDNNHPVVGLDVSHSASDWAKALGGAPVVILATPFKALPQVLAQLKSEKLSGVINASKGIDRDSLLSFSHLSKTFLKCPVATLSGPTFAREVMERKPTACVLASKDSAFAKKMALAFSNKSFRVYLSRDIIGVEICGAIKNVLAIACGISDGLKLGNNARAALLTRGLHEMATLVAKMGGSKQTVSGLAGTGDLWLTATGDLSRNRQLGLRLASGEKIDEALKKLEGPAEGYYTVYQVAKLAKKYKLDLPICEQMYRLVENQTDPRRAIDELMTRSLKSEI